MSKPQVMTKADLLDWVKAYDCEILPLEEHKAHVLKLFNPKTKGDAFLDLPIDDKRPVKDFTVCKVCMRLGIPVPTHAEYTKSLHDKLKKEHEDEE